MQKKLKTKEWETKNSSLAKISKHELEYEECRKFACEDIASKLTHIEKQGMPFIVEIPKGTEFHFIGRVCTNKVGYIPEAYYKQFEERKYISFSTINNRNISRYRGRAFFIYDMLPEDIVHIFPLDSDTAKYAESEKTLTLVPSLWLTLKELEDLTAKLKVYNQVTCKTKRNGEIIKPIAVVAFGKIDEEIQEIAKEFGISCVIVHPDDDAINYGNDLLYDPFQLYEVSVQMEELYGMNVEWLIYED